MRTLYFSGSGPTCVPSGSRETILFLCGINTGFACGGAITDFAELADGGSGGGGGGAPVDAAPLERAEGEFVLRLVANRRLRPPPAFERSSGAHARSRRTTRPRARPGLRAPAQPLPVAPLLRSPRPRPPLALEDAACPISTG